MPENQPPESTGIGTPDSDSRPIQPAASPHPALSPFALPFQNFAHEFVFFRARILLRATLSFWSLAGLRKNAGFGLKSAESIPQGLKPR